MKNTPHTQPILIAKSITKEYGQEKVLKDVDLIVHCGERVGVMAPSGAGKTTLLQILAGLDRDFTGSCTLYSKETNIVFQESALFSHKTLEENIFFPHKKKVHSALYARWLEVTGLEKYIAYYPHQVSRGMCQKTALVRAFINSPRLVFLDEPFSAIDEESKHHIMAFILINYLETALIVVSHSEKELETLCDRVHFL